MIKNVILPVAISVVIVTTTPSFAQEEYNIYEPEPLTRATITDAEHEYCTIYEAEYFQDKEIINTACPVTGVKVSNEGPYKAEFRGEILGFCCPKCIQMFCSEPDKYIDNLEKYTKE